MTLLKAPRHAGLKPEELKFKCNPENFEFESTRSVSPITEIIGQERALKALKVGVELWSAGYNIFIAGLSGTGKFTTVKTLLESIRPQCPVLKDYAYVNNFCDQDKPVLLVFPSGQASKFKHDLSSTIQYLQSKIPQALEADTFKCERQKIITEFNSKEQDLMATFEERLKKENFSLGQIKVGEVSRPEVLPVIDDQPIIIQQLEEQIKQGKINKEKAIEITTKYAIYQDELQTVFKKGLTLSQEYQDKLQSLEKDAVKLIVKGAISTLKEKYCDGKIGGYLDQVEENILESLDVFKGTRPKSEETDEGFIIDYFKEYDVNIILDNSETKECPIIIETSPSYNNLFGTIEKFSDGHGGWYADFTKIKAGSLLKANGGYLVLNAMDALQEPGVWKSLKRVLMYGKLDIQDFLSYYLFSPTVLKPEPIELNTKIILIGSQYLYHVMANYEDDFKKIFKIKADFDYEMPRNEKTIDEYVRFIKMLIEKEGLKEFDKSAIAAIIEYGSRYADNKNKLTTRFSFIADLLRESNFWASDNGADIVSNYHVHQAYNNARERHGLYESKMQELISEGTILIDTEGEKVGQINGLAVYDVEYFSFGKPARITSTVSLGNGNIVNVEREAGLSGHTHDKGILIISGYFKETFGQKTPLTFSASIVFEQGYGYIDGDSASGAEVCTLLSNFSGVPIKQSFAMTGSVNQKGEIQPIGGVNEKIEGFFDVCRKRGLTQKQGVIIPIQNVSNLMLRDDIVEAVKNKIFNIYPVARIEDAIEILTGVKAGKRLQNGSFEKDSLFALVEKKLKDMHNKVKPPEPKKGQKKVIKRGKK